MNFDDWAARNLSKKSLKNENKLDSTSIFDTNFNAEKLASRRIERSLFLKLKNNQDELTNFYNYRYDKKSGVRIDPRTL